MNEPEKKIIGVITVGGQVRPIYESERAGGSVATDCSPAAEFEPATRLDPARSPDVGALGKAWEEVEHSALQLAAVKAAIRNDMPLAEDSESISILRLGEAAKAWLELCGWQRPAVANDEPETESDIVKNFRSKCDDARKEYGVSGRRNAAAHLLGHEE